MKQLIIVLGMHRSGTSMVAQVCQCMGAYLGEKNELMIATENNPDGYFENTEISYIDDAILHLCGREWYDLERVELDYENPQIRKTAENLRNVIQKLFDKSDIIAIKDPRISLLLPLWEKLLEELRIKAHYVWVYRNPLEVMESLQKRDGYSEKHGLSLWVHYNFSILKFLKDKEYLLFNYKHVLENVQLFESLSVLLGKEFDDTLKYTLAQTVKHKYCHSSYSYQDVKKVQSELLDSLYGALLERREKDIDISFWEKKYSTGFEKVERKYIDYEILEDIECLKKREIIIYGAGNFGHQAAKMLQQLDFFKFDFCDKDPDKHGMNILGRKVLSIKEVEERESLCVIIAIERKETRKAIEKTFLYTKKVEFFSFFALKTIWKCHMGKDMAMGDIKEAIFSWHKEEFDDKMYYQV